VTAAKSVLIVDDEPGFCETLQDVFEDEGYQVHTAPDGAAALALLARLPRRPCVVLCDVHMPVMDGIAFYEAMKADPALRVIPFVFTTTDPTRAPAGELIMKKPVNYDILLDTVRKCCDGAVSVAS
jgi:CheY-like chemotaxis protein